MELTFDQCGMNGFIILHQTVCVCVKLYDTNIFKLFLKPICSWHAKVSKGKKAQDSGCCVKHDATTSLYATKSSICSFQISAKIVTIAYTKLSAYFQDYSQLPNVLFPTIFTSSLLSFPKSSQSCNYRVESLNRLGEAERGIMKMKNTLWKGTIIPWG